MTRGGGFFLTLTYDDEHLPVTPTGRPTTCKKDVQDFFKRLRKELGDVRLRYYLVSEYGPKTFRPHYHGIFFIHRDFSGSVDSCLRFSLSDTFTLREADDLFAKVWHNGFTCTEAVTPATINYVTKYVITRRGEFDEFDDRERPFSLSSRRPGIGAGYIDRMQKWHSEHPDGFYATELGGTKVALPRYYVEKLYTDAQRRAHSLQVQEALKEKPVRENFDYEQAYTQRFRKRILMRCKKSASISI